MSSAKISGYLEKKGKLRFGSPWKKYWFELDGRLLVYYRSKDEYEAISPCKGSINLCPPCTIKPTPSSSCVFQIECRASTVNLRAESRAEEEKWLEALLNATTTSTKSSPNRMSYFRYSFDDLPSRPYLKPSIELKENINQFIKKERTRPNSDITFTSGDEIRYSARQKRRSAPADFSKSSENQKSKEYFHNQIKYESNNQSESIQIDHNENSIDKEYSNQLYEALDLYKETKSMKLNKEKTKTGTLKMISQFIKQEKKQDEKIRNKVRSTSFIKRVLKRRNKSVKSEADILYESVSDETIDDKQNDEMLNELQQILETRKNIFQRKLQQNVTKNYDTQSQNSDMHSIRSIEIEEILERPALPPKTFTPSNPKTIDEILQDLETDSHQNVKELINKFNGDSQVVLRKKGVVKSSSDSKVMEHLQNQRTSDLGELLEELSKVTCAPILTPGVTCSLITTSLTDDEWLKLIPIRQRRCSDPDYDVPRPHRSLQFDSTGKYDEDRIQATRFFGPVLPSTVASTRSDSPQSIVSTMDPDSLELDSIPIMETKRIPFEIEQERNVSYTSHNYVKFNQVIYGNCLDKTSFIDSLEPHALTELSTVF